MDDGKKSYLISLLLVSTFAGAVGQLLLKYGLLNSGAILIVSIVIGVLAYAFSTLIYLYVLGRMHLSWVYGFGGLSYVFVSILSVFVLGEAVGPLRWIGIVVIAIGTALVSMS